MRGEWEGIGGGGVGGQAEGVIRAQAVVLCSQ